MDEELNISAEEVVDAPVEEVTDEVQDEVLVDEVAPLEEVTE